MLKTTIANSFLLDTSIWLAILNRTDKAHSAAIELFERPRAQLLTTNAVLTETMYMVRRFKGVGSTCLDHVIKGVVDLIPLDIPDWNRVKILMEKYSGIPMSFADATLVVASEETKIETILTLDRRGFEAYRLYDSKPFIILP